MNQVQMSNDSLNRAVSGQSVMNYSAIFEGFMQKGIPASEILPRENVLTFWAWKALGRSVKKGEHGVKACTFVSVAGKRDEPDAKGYKMPRSVTVFHISQTEPLKASN